MKNKSNKQWRKPCQPPDSLLSGLSQLCQDKLTAGDICMEYIANPFKFSSGYCQPRTRMGFKNLLLNWVAASRMVRDVDATHVKESRKVLHVCVVVSSRHSEGQCCVGSMTSRGNGLRFLRWFDSPIILVFRLKNDALRTLFLETVKMWSQARNTIRYQFSNWTPFRDMSFGNAAQKQLLEIAQPMDLGAARAPMHCSEFVCAAGATAAALYHQRKSGDDLPTVLRALSSAKKGIPGWAFLMHPKNIMTTNLYQRLMTDAAEITLIGYVIASDEIA